MPAVQAAAASHTSSQPRSPGTPGGVDVRPWEMRFDDLEIIRPAGEGSFGKAGFQHRHSEMQIQMGAMAVLPIHLLATAPL